MRLADIIYYIHEIDLDQYTHPSLGQFATRMLYNAYPVFRLNYVLDTHVYPCDESAVDDIFNLFDKTYVDIAISSRIPRKYVMGGGVLFKANNNTHEFWKLVYQRMREIPTHCDQRGIMDILNRSSNKTVINFKWLSSNWYYASHGISQNGEFQGPARCYRSSIPVNGMVRFIHGHARECDLMNGFNNSLINTQRAWFQPGLCNTTRKEVGIARSENELKNFIGNNISLPKMNWKKYSQAPSKELLWPDFVYG